MPDISGGLKEYLTSVKSLAKERKGQEIYETIQQKYNDTQRESELRSLKENNDELKKRLEDLQDIVVQREGGTVILRANGTESLAKTLKLFTDRYDQIQSFLSRYKETKRKREYTTIPLKEQEALFLSKTILTFEEQFAVHLPAIKQIQKKNHATSEANKHRRKERLKKNNNPISIKIFPKKR